MFASEVEAGADFGVARTDPSHVTASFSPEFKLNVREIKYKVKDNTPYSFKAYRINLLFLNT